jgi:histidine triad (HIT) family protein
VADCIFCSIAAGDAPADVVRRDESFVAFRDIAPKAPVHLVVIPVRHIRSIAEIGELSEAERAGMLPFIAAAAEEAGLGGSGFRVTTNHGPDARQSVFHLHWHIMGGAPLSDTM